MSVPVYRYLPLLLHSLGAVVLLRDQVYFVRFFQRTADLHCLLRRPVCADYVPPVTLSIILMDLVRLLLLDLPSGTTYLNICVILNFR